MADLLYSVMVGTAHCQMICITYTWRFGGGSALVSKRLVTHVYVTNFLFIEGLFQHSPSKPVLVSKPDRVNELAETCDFINEPYFTPKNSLHGKASVLKSVFHNDKRTCIHFDALVLRHMRCPMSTDFYSIMPTVYNLCLL
jgi:hypothetical protein